MNKKTTLDELREICRKAGIKLTPQRLEIFEAISGAKDHPSAEALYEKLKKRMPTISLDTIYRTLNTFEKLGIIKRVHLLNDQARFDPDMKVHHHFICTKCKKIIDFEWVGFDSMGFPEGVEDFGEIFGRQVELRGICRDCLKKEERK